MVAKTMKLELLLKLIANFYHLITTIQHLFFCFFPEIAELSIILTALRFLL